MRQSIHSDYYPGLSARFCPITLRRCPLAGPSVEQWTAESIPRVDIGRASRRYGSAPSQWQSLDAMKTAESFLIETFYYERNRTRSQKRKRKSESCREQGEKLTVAENLNVIGVKVRAKYWKKVLKGKYWKNLAFNVSKVWPYRVCRDCVAVLLNRVTLDFGV